MNKSKSANRCTTVAPLNPTAMTADEGERLKAFFAEIGTGFGADASMARLPFAPGDVTAGVENEMQTAVRGAADRVDLALTIQHSNFFANIERRMARGRSSRRVRSDLEAYLRDNPDGVWENSQVRVPADSFNALASSVLNGDLRADKSRPDLGLRADAGNFLVGEGAQQFVRMPISYLLKFALADYVGGAPLPTALKTLGLSLLPNFLNDNTSPEQTSFYVSTSAASARIGNAVVKETAQRYLLTQLLVAYANDKFRLREHGQECLVYFSALPPQRQKRLNECVSDSFYRDLFMNPCLSGWDRGEAKHDYMHLCHSVLSRSQLHALPRLRQLGIIKRNLVVVPTVSNTSLANNGTHVSIGSLRLGRAFAARGDGGYRADERYTGDLAVKAIEHFLPLFVDTYSGAPHRLDFTDFHPERVLAFLPHQLDDTHLRMIWQSWKRKADISVAHTPMTPFGIGALDRGLSGAFDLRGDFTPDYRLLDYFVALLSTDRSAGLDGTVGNSERLKRDLEEAGIFAAHMTTYLPYRPREFAQMGFAGYEARTYSVFENLGRDLGGATGLQTLITALAYKYMATGAVGHSAIPDNPEIESERRQFMFAAAIGLPFCYVRCDTGNLFLRRILAHTRRSRPSKFYRGYLKVSLADYRGALIRMLHADAPDLIETFGLAATLADTQNRIDDPNAGASGRLNTAVLSALGARSPLHVPAHDYNRAAERHYRETLRRAHTEECFDLLLRDCLALEDADGRGAYDHALREVMGEQSALAFALRVKRDALNETLPLTTLRQLIALVLIVIGRDRNVHLAAIDKASRLHNDGPTRHAHSTPLYRTGNG